MSSTNIGLRIDLGCGAVKKEGTLGLDYVQLPTVDYSSNQAMGLTALEAMAGGAAVIVPAHGGAVSFAVHSQNSLVVETASQAECWQAMQRLVEDHDFRRRLQFQAIQDVCHFYPERPAFNIVTTLFKTRSI